MFFWYSTWCKRSALRPQPPPDVGDGVRFKFNLKFKLCPPAPPTTCAARMLAAKLTVPGPTTLPARHSPARHNHAARRSTPGGSELHAQPAVAPTHRPSGLCCARRVPQVRTHWLRTGIRMTLEPRCLCAAGPHRCRCPHDDVWLPRAGLQHEVRLPDLPGFLLYFPPRCARPQPWFPAPSPSSL